VHAAIRSDDPAQRPIPRSRIAVGLDPALRGRLAVLAAGRAIAIDWFTSRARCTSVWVGDLTARWVEPGTPVESGLVPLAPIDGVPVLAAAGLLDLLATTGPSLRLSGPVFARHLSIELADPVAWLDFLETPLAHRRH
jgi:hypothetical protein